MLVVQLAVACGLPLVKSLVQMWPQVPQLNGPPALLNPLSTVPSQSPSRLLQVSAAGPVYPTHTRLPLWHCVVPCRQRPVSQCDMSAIAGLQLTPPPGLPSSICPLQSLSRPSQTSAPVGVH